MCHFVLAVLPADADMPAFDALARTHGRRLQRVENADVERQLGSDWHCHLTTPGHCDCGTVIGSRLRAVAPDWDAETRKLVRKGWSEAKASRTIAQRRAQEGQSPSADTLAQWVAFIEAMRTQRRAAGFGLMLHMARGALDEPFAVHGVREVARKDDLADALVSMEEDVLYRFMPEKSR